MRLTFTLPARFHPAYSLLGRWMQRRLGDPRRAEALFLVVLSMALLGLVLAQYTAWIWLKPAITAAPSGGVAIAFWGSQVGSLMLFLGLCVIGFNPAVTVMLTPTGLLLRRGSQERALPYTDINAVESIPALTYHRHYARYAATQTFVNRVTSDVLLLHTTDAPVAVGLLPADLARLHDHLEECRAPSFDLPAAQVA